MSRRTRWYKRDESDEDDVKDDAGEENVGSILKLLRTKLSEVLTLISDIEKKFDEKFARHDNVINNLLTRIEYLETRTEYSIHLSKLNKRKIDDSEQVSKKINLIIEGIPVEKEEHPGSLLAKIKEEIGKFNLGISDTAYDRCHRIGRKSKSENPDGSVIFNQPIVLKMCYWRDKDIIYQNRKKNLTLRFTRN